MRNLLALSALLVLIFLGLGWYLGWYKIQTSTTEDGHRNVSIDLNTKQIQSDVSKVINKEGTTPATPTPPKTVPGTPTGYQREDGSFVFPGEPFTPTPPGSGPRLPPPR